jgi:NAD(P)H-flavin reductase
MASPKTLFHEKKAIVEKVIRETDETRSILLRPEGGFAFKPGQFAMLTAPEAGEAPFAPSSSPGKTDTVQFTVKRAGRVSSAMHALKPGDIAGIRGPYGKPFSPGPQEDPEILIVCRDIGMANAVPFLHAVPELTTDFAKTVIWADPSSEFPKESEIPHFNGTTGLMRLAVSSGNRPAADFAAGLKRSGIHPERASVLLFCGDEENRSLAESVHHSGFRPEFIFIWTERKMSCAIGQCRHCAIGHVSVCLEGPLLPWSVLRSLRG